MNELFEFALLIFKFCATFTFGILVFVAFCAFVFGVVYGIYYVISGIYNYIQDRKDKKVKTDTSEFITKNGGHVAVGWYSPLAEDFISSGKEELSNARQYKELEDWIVGAK